MTPINGQNPLFLGKGLINHQDGQAVIKTRRGPVIAERTEAGKWDLSNVLTGQKGSLTVDQSGPFKHLHKLTVETTDKNGNAVQNQMLGILGPFHKGIAFVDPDRSGFQAKA